MKVSVSHQVAQDRAFLDLAAALAEKALGRTLPNPAVGCVLVRQGRVIGEGFHARAGEPHAEAMAIAAARESVRGATAYVTLEPCAPSAAKRTPPCAPMLAQAGIARVVYASRDENELVRGRGLRLLRRAGVRVDKVQHARAKILTQHFSSAQQNTRPFVTLKAGVSLDGKIATAAGDSKWITSPSQRRTARSLRGLFSGVAVGVETVLNDDPLLLPSSNTRRPFFRVVFDSMLRTPTRSRLVSTASTATPVCIVTSPRAHARRRGALEAAGARVIAVPTSREGLRLSVALTRLAAEGIVSLLVEGGSKLHGSFARERLFDEFLLFRAPILIGGQEALSVIGGAGPRRVSQALKMARLTASSSLALHFASIRRLDQGGLEAYRPVKGA